KGGNRRVQVASDAHAASVRSRMAALAAGIGPCEACACQIEAAQGMAVFGKGKERGADVVDETRQGAFDRVKRAARPLLGLEEKHAPTVAGQRRGCHKPVRASAHHDGIEHACDPGWLRLRRTAPYARRTVRLYRKRLLLRLLGLFDDDIRSI